MARHAREEFLRVLATSTPPQEVGQLHLFHDDDEAFIAREVDRHLYEPRLPCAGDRERRWVARLEVMAADKEWEGHQRAWVMAQKFKAVLPEAEGKSGRYYTRTKLTPKANKEEFKWVMALIEAARAAKQWDRKWFAEQLLAGMPESVSNFELECLFLLRNSEGLVTRLVRLKNIKGETSRGPNPGGSEVLDSDSFASSEKFSRWCLLRGNFVWDSGVTELRMLQEDMANDAAFRIVNEVQSVGWYPIRSERAIKADLKIETGIWFADECAYVTRTDGSTVVLRPDSDNIIWHDGEGYFLSRKGRESNFLQGRPQMRPEQRVVDLLNPKDWENQPAARTDQEFLRAYFREVCHRMQETLGGLEANLALGVMFSYAAAPEFFKKYGFFPGLFVHGIKGSGKTKFTSWLMSVWGYQMQSGISLSEKTSTAVGMLQEAENYSNQPVWFDEFRDHQIDPGKISIMRNAFDRSSQAKWSHDGKQREIKTVFVLSGESTTTDAATRQRYPHIQVSAHRRIKNHLEWFTNNRENFFVFGRVLLERRPEFLKHFFMYLKNWLENPHLADLDQRDKAVHGVGYSAWLAMMTLLESHTSEEMSEFKQFMLGHVRQAAKDVNSDTNISVFCQDMVTVYEAGAIPLDCFRLKAMKREHPPGAVNVDGEGRYVQGWWLECELYIHINLVISHMQTFLTKQRGAITLNRKDLRDQLSKEPYWIEGEHTMRFPGSEGTKKAFGWKVDLHPLGYQPVSDERYNKYLLNAGDGDPRKGPLFSIVDALLERERNEQRSLA